MKKANRIITISSRHILSLLQADLPYIDFFGRPFENHDRDCISVPVHIPFLDEVEEGEELSRYIPEKKKG